MISVDLRIGFKFFDQRSELTEALTSHDLDSQYIETLEQICRGSTTVGVKVHQDTPELLTGIEVHQRNSISSKLFTAVIEEVFRKLN